MTKIDLTKLLVAVSTAAAASVAADDSNKMTTKEVPAVTAAAKDAAKVDPAIKEAQQIIDVKTNQEPWYQSVQALTSIWMAIAAICGATGLIIPEEFNKTILAMIPLIAGGVGGAALVYNRYFRFGDQTPK